MQLRVSTSPRAFLRTLLWLRVSAVVGQLATIYVAHATLHVALPLQPMLTVVATLAGIAAVAALRLRAPWPATQAEVALQLCVDIAALSALLYLSGGIANPFSSLYLVPIALAAVGLSRRYALGITLACVVAYIGLMPASLPLHHAQLAGAAQFNLHLWGMAANFGISAVLLTVFLIAMHREIRAHEHALARLREDTLRREHVTAIGLLAAGAAHELSTPLSTMAILASELKSALTPNSEARADVELIERQIRLCKERLSGILRDSGQERAPEARAMRVQSLIDETLEAWRVVYPGARVTVAMAPAIHDRSVRVDAGCAQSLINLLTNAMQASSAQGSDRVTVSVDVTNGSLMICIDDEGRGIDPSMGALAGRSFVSDKSDGFGLGLVLSNANLNRLGGEVTFNNRRGGGTRTAIRLPLAGEMPA